MNAQHTLPLTHSYQCTTDSVHDCVHIHMIAHAYRAHTYLDNVVPVSTDYLLIIILEAADSLTILTVALNTGQRVMTLCPIQL